MSTGPLQGTGGHGGSLVRFIIVGIINTLVGAGVMFFMYNILGAGYWVSSALNYIAGSIVSYFLNKYFTFRQKQKSLRIVLSFIIMVPRNWTTNCHKYSEHGIIKNERKEQIPCHAEVITQLIQDQNRS